MLSKSGGNFPDNKLSGPPKKWLPGRDYLLGGVITMVQVWPAAILTWSGTWSI
jgi:hypothetical protein